MENITRERILIAAEKLFAAKGYDAVTIREVTSKARCNLSLVYYYFGSKKKLYLEVFRSRWVQRALELHRAFFGVIEKQKPQSLEEIIHILTEIYLERKMDAENIQIHLQLIARELQKPTEALDLVFHEVMKPFFSKLEELIRPFIDPRVSHDNVVLSLFSIFAQIIHFIHSRHVLPKIMERSFDATMKKLLVEHITNFSLYGMNALMVKESS